MDLENIVVDITQRNYNTLQTIQYDVDSRYVNVKIVNNGKNVDLTNYMVSIACKKPDGKIVFNETEMVEPKQGLIKFLISEQITTALGEVVCELKIYGKNSSVLTTQYFTINVTKPIADKSIQSTNEFRQLTVAMNEYNAWISKVEEKYNGLEKEYAEELTGVKSGLEETNAQLYNTELRVKNTLLLSNVINKLNHGNSLKSVCQGDSLTYGQDTVSSDIRNADAELCDDGSAHTFTRASITYPEHLEAMLKDTYPNHTITVINKGYSGDWVGRGLTRWTQNENADIVFLMYGTNDSNMNMTNISERGDVTAFISNYRVLIERYLSWGTAVVLMIPPRTLIQIIDGLRLKTYRNLIYRLANEYNIPVIDTEELFNGMRPVVFSDQVHFNEKGYKVIANGVFSHLIGYGLLNDRWLLHSNETLGIRTSRDNFIYKNVTFGNYSTSDFAQESSTGNGLVINLTRNSVINYSFKTLEDNLVLLPIYSTIGGSGLKVTVDNEIEQGTLTLKQESWSETGNAPKSVVEFSLASTAGVNRDRMIAYAYENGDFIHLSNKGVHNLKIEQTNKSVDGTAWNGFIVLTYNDFIKEYQGVSKPKVFLTHDQYSATPDVANETRVKLKETGLLTYFKDGEFWKHPAIKVTVTNYLSSVIVYGFMLGSYNDSSNSKFIGEIHKYNISGEERTITNIQFDSNTKEFIITWGGSNRVANFKFELL